MHSEGVWGLTWDGTRSLAHQGAVAVDSLPATGRLREYVCGHVHMVDE